MKQILLVDDDPVIVEIYRRKFLKSGFGVEVAEDGLAAMKMLSLGTKPDLVVLDLMMPKMSGVDVLKFMRSRPEFKATPVIIFSNAYMADLVQAAAVAGADRALLKARCPPAVLVEAVNQLLSGEQVPESDTIMLAAADYAPTMAAATGPQVPVAQADNAASSGGASAEEPPKTESSQTATQAKLHTEFVAHSAGTLKTIHEMVERLVAASDPKARQLRLVELYRKLHFVTAMAGMAGCGQIAHFGSALEALLFELQERPDHLGPSTLQTITQSVELLATLFERASHSAAEEIPSASVLVVDDDVISNRLTVTALRRANFKAISEGDPVAALEVLKSSKFDLVLLDISMPELDGFQLCAEIRKLPAYQNTPVIFVTCHSDFESRTRGILSGGNDLIAKPILPIELAVKSVTHLLHRRLLDPTR